MPIKPPAKNDRSPSPSQQKMSRELMNGPPPGHGDVPVVPRGEAVDRHDDEAPRRAVGRPAGRLYLQSPDAIWGRTEGLKREFYNLQPYHVAALEKGICALFPQSLRSRVFEVAKAIQDARFKPGFRLRPTLAAETLFAYSSRDLVARCREIFALKVMESAHSYLSQIDLDRLGEKNKKVSSHRVDDVFYVLLNLRDDDFRLVRDALQSLPSALPRRCQLTMASAMAARPHVARSPMRDRLYCLAEMVWNRVKSQHTKMGHGTNYRFAEEHSFNALCWALVCSKTIGNLVPGIAPRDSGKMGEALMQDWITELMSPHSEEASRDLDLVGMRCFASDFLVSLGAQHRTLPQDFARARSSVSLLCRGEASHWDLVDHVLQLSRQNELRAALVAKCLFIVAQPALCWPDDERAPPALPEVLAAMGWPKAQVPTLAALVAAWPHEAQRATVQRSIAGIAALATFFGPHLPLWLSDPDGIGPQLLLDVCRLQQHSLRSDVAFSVLRLCGDAQGRRMLAERAALSLDDHSEVRLIGALIVSLQRDGVDVSPMQQMLRVGQNSIFDERQKAKILLAYLAGLAEDVTLAVDIKTKILAEMCAHGPGEQAYRCLQQAVIVASAQRSGELAVRGCTLALEAAATMRNVFGGLGVADAETRFNEFWLDAKTSHISVGEVLDAMAWPAEQAAALAAVVAAWPHEAERPAVRASVAAIAAVATFLRPDMPSWLADPAGVGPQLVLDICRLRQPELRRDVASRVLQLCADPQGRRMLEDRPALSLDRHGEGRLIGALLVILQQQDVDVSPMHQLLQRGRKSVFKDGPKMRSLLSYLLVMAGDNGLAVAVKTKILAEICAGGPGKQAYRRLQQAVIVAGAQRSGRLAEPGSTLAAEADAAFRDIFGELGVADAEVRFGEIFGTGRAKEAVWAYAASIKQLGDPSVEEAFERFIREVLTGQFERNRNDPALNPHLELLASLDARFLKPWQHAMPPQTTGAQTGRVQESFGAAWLAPLLLEHGHMGQLLDQVPLLRDYLEAPEQAARQAAAEALREQAQNLSSLQDADRAGPRLAALCVQLCEGDVAEQKQHLRAMQAELEGLRPQPELAHDVRHALQRLKHAAVPALRLQLLDSADPHDLLLCGTEVTGSCQRVDGTPHLNQGLVGTLLNGQTRLLAAKQPSTGKMVSRCLLRALTDGTRPVLYLEPLYGDPAYRKDLLRLARAKAEAVGAPLTSATGERGSLGAELVSVGGRAPFEYCDGASEDKLSRGSRLRIVGAQLE